MISVATKLPRPCALLAAFLSLAYFLALQCYFVPVTRGGDRNGYLLGGKMLADGHARGVVPADPFIFLGPHWVMVAPGAFALKYPLGLPALYAIIHQLFGAERWLPAAHELSPLAASVALFGSYLLFRPLVGSFRAILGLILLATTPVTFFFANLPNSHAVALCTAVWGMAALLQWWRRPNIYVAIVAGLLLGFNFTVRYSEGLLLLPLLLVIYFKTRNDRCVLRQAIPLPLAWITPVSILLIYNLIVLHHLTGYGLTNESTAFSIASLIQNARTMLVQLFDNVLWLLLPFSLLGLIALFRQNRRLALVLLSWPVPTILLYTAYYWVPAEEPGLSYARFVLTVLPALILFALFLPPRDSTVATVAIGLIVAIISARNLRAAAARGEDLQWDNLGSLVLDQQVQSQIPPGSVIFTEQPNIPLLELSGDWRLYLSNLFTRPYIQSYAAIDPNVPRILQAQRAQQLFNLLGSKSAADLVAQQNGLITQSLSQGHRVYAVLPAPAMQQFRDHFLNSPDWKITVTDSWTIDPRWRGTGSSESLTMLQIISVER
jgi:hypothetical protein